MSLYCSVNNCVVVDFLRIAPIIPRLLTHQYSITDKSHIIQIEKLMAEGKEIEEHAKGLIPDPQLQ